MDRQGTDRVGTTQTTSTKGSATDPDTNSNEPHLTDPSSTSGLERNLSLLAIEETPRRCSSTDTTNVHQKTLKTLRIMYIKELGPTIPEVSWDFFAGAILPHVPADKLEKICKAVNASDTLVADNRWKVFPLDPSNKKMPVEDVTFSVMTTIWDRVVAIAETELNKKPTSRLQSKPTQTMSSETALGASFKSDAITTSIISRGAGTGPDWKIPKKKSQIQQPSSLVPPPPPPPNTSSTLLPSPIIPDKLVVNKEVEAQQQHEALSREAADATTVWEYKCQSNPKETNQNVLQVVGAASHILHNDPCRRHTFGVTIEDKRTRVWYFSRSLAMVSESFDFITENRNRFIHLLVSLAFATDVEIGFDPSVKRRLVQHDDAEAVICYDILVNGRWYQTMDCLDNYRASRVVGRATRVWQVRLRPEEAKNDEEKSATYALKDVWIGETARSEKMILDDICTRVNTVYPISDFEEDFRERYFMDILADEVVRVDGSDDTLSNFLGAIPFPKDYGSFKLEEELDPPTLVTTLRGSQSTTPVGASVPDTTEPSGNRASKASAPSFEARQHRRILFRDVGKTLGKISNLQEYLTHLAHVTKGLEYMHSAGYVHRDYSPTNLLVCRGLCKITDLEYCKQYDQIKLNLIDDAAKHGFKTGTPAFMPIEMLDGRYLFRPAPTAQPSTLLQNYLQGQQDWVPAPTVVRHNYLHDIESIWWIAMYGLLTTVPVNTDRASTAQDRQLEVATAVFRNRLECSIERRSLIQEREELHRLSNQILPHEYCASSTFVTAVAICLTSEYRIFEQFSDTYDFSRISKTYMLTKGLYEQAASVAVTQTMDLPGWKSREIEPKVQVRGQKRKQNDEQTTEVSSSKRNKLGQA
ncbi:hypothetical protein QCA50_011790 [Cerrena zonata]|uniref:Protein kinase domain-containing protein n=1 Tax=Cerrena zonata TaxID=2478898 RepID=A0AAW0G7H5_9APHY